MLSPLKFASAGNKSIFCRVSLIAALALSFCAAVQGEKINDIQPQGYVTDLAGVIDPATRQKIELLATEVQQKTGAQIAVVTVNSMEGETREDYAAELYKHLGIGAKRKDNGVLILIAPKDRQYKIEVGYGLEPVINDARAGDVGARHGSRSAQGRLQFCGTGRSDRHSSVHRCRRRRATQRESRNARRGRRRMRLRGGCRSFCSARYLPADSCMSRAGRRGGGPPASGGGGRQKRAAVDPAGQRDGAWWRHWGGGYGGSSGG